MATDSEIYEKAAQILMEGGHCKRMLWDEQGRHCAVGALVAAGQRLGVDAFGSDGILGRIESKIGDMHVVQWNNAPETTGEDVILLFKELAAETADPA